MKNINEKHHRDCESHTATNCDLNDHRNLEPGADDCGHTVAAGPGTLGVPDLNTYETDANGRTAIVAGQPEHNLDQDPTHGPGMKN